MNRPHPARMWNYWLGGKDKFQVDREVGDQVVAAHPGILEVARASRACLGRMVCYLAAEEGIRQFLDIGTGLPTEGNTHEVAQRVASESKVVYVDSDPLVLSHARALLASGPEGACGYIDCDVRDPGRQEALRIAVERGSSPYVARTPCEIAAFFDGLELIEPGVVSTSLWRAEASSSGTPHEVDAIRRLARKP